MFYFLLPLSIGFVCNLGSAFTAVFSQRWGERRGSMISVLLRNILGIPVWAIGFFLAVLTSSPKLFTPTLVTTLLGWLLIVIGGVIILTALFTIRFRSIKPSIQDSLAESGIYARVRHPIHTGTLLEFIGLVIVIPTLTVAVACGVGVAWVFVQTWFEEVDLLQRMENYREYKNAVPRFFPRIRMK